MIRRVLMTADAVGGVWTYALELARELAARDVEVLLAVMGPGPSEQRREAALQIRGLQLEHQPFALEWMERPWADVRRAGDWLLGLEAKFRPDICHLNGYSHGACAFAAPRVVVAHSCVCSWHQAVRGTPAPGMWSKYRRKVCAGLAAADAVIAPTHWMLRALVHHYGPQLRGSVIANARSPEGFGAARKEALIFAAGRVWDEAKNLQVLDEASRTLSWPVMIAGATASEGRPSATFSHCRLLGELEPAVVARWLARASIYALPAKYEPFGLSALEAALSGCALVLGDIDSLRETWADAAIFVSPDRPRELTQVLSELIAKPRLRRVLGERALERAQRFAPRAQATAYLETYRSLTESAGSPACAS